MAGRKAAKDVEEGDLVMIKSFPVQVRRVLDSATLGRDEYIFTGYDIIDSNEYSGRFSPNDLVALVEVKQIDKQVVCDFFLSELAP